MDQNSHFWGRGNKGDLALSYEDYFSLNEIILDDRLSDNGMLRFKNLHEINSYGLVGVPLSLLPAGVALTQFLYGPVRRSHSGYRPFFVLFSIAFPLVCWAGYTTPLNRRLYTQIFASDDMDGSYVRNRVK